MNDTPSKVVHRQKALFSRDLPFKPQYGMMLYVESCANEEINGYFHKNMIGQRSGHEGDGGGGGVGEGDSTIILNSSRLHFV